MLDPRLLAAFVAVVETGSFTQAAERLHLTQSTISQQLGRLEDVVGRSLIDRAARPVQATVAGERLLGYARRILALQDEAQASLAHNPGVTSIRIGLPEDIVTGPMAQAFADFSRSHRQVRLDVTTGLSRDLTRRYRTGEFDIVIVKEDTPSPDCSALFPEALAWFEAADAPQEWTDPLPLVAFPQGGLYRDAMFQRIERQRRSWYVAFAGSSLQSVVVAVEAGLGLSLLPVSTASGRRLRGYEAFGDEPDIVVSLYAWEQSGSIADLADRMKAALAERFNELSNG